MVPLPELLATILGLLAAAQLSAADPQSIDGLHGLGTVFHHEIASERAGHRYHILVGLPADYDASKERRYPVVYVLDGGALFPMIRAYQRYLVFDGSDTEALEAARAGRDAAAERRPTLAVLVDSPDFNLRLAKRLRRLGDGLRAVAWAADRVVEAVELDGHPDVLAVQWHPEASPGPYDTEFLFDTFAKTLEGA